ncbi:MAG: CPBP family intramembrane glutamic endopeptidase [Chloroflexota bacterium]
MLDLIFLFVMLLGLTVTANLVEREGSELYRRVFDWLLLAFTMPLLIIGLLLILIPGGFFEQMPDDVGLIMPNVTAAGFVFLGMGLWGVFVSFYQGRQLLARLVPLRPESAVHGLALVFCSFLVGNSAFTLSQGGLDGILETTYAASLYEVVGQQVLFILLAFFGAGLLVRRDNESLNERLGLKPVTWGQIGYGLKWILILALFQWTVSAIWAWVDPDQLELLETISAEMFSEFTSVWDWFVLSLAAGFGEELLFRGALQPVLGLTGTSFLFAIAHVQYGITPITFAILVIGFALGYIRQKTSTSIAIFVHFGYNFFISMMALLASYAEQWL